MKTVWVAGLLLLVTALGGFAHAADEKKDPKKDAPAEPEFRFLPDGSVERDGIITRYWQVNHQIPKDIETELKKFLDIGKNKGDVEILAHGKNLLRISAPAEKWRIIEQLLDVIDVADPQVFVEAKIIEIKYDSNLEFGFEGTYDRRKGADATQPFFGKFTGTFDPESYLEALGTNKPFQGGTFEFQNHPGSINKRGEYTYILRALQERGSAEILSQPSIIALQGEPAEINTGVQFPVQSVDVRGNQSIITTRFEKTGITLKITPELVGREFVKLDINATDSQITERIPGPSGSLNPVISNRTAHTKVSVRDGETVIIGGLLSSSTIESKSGLPLLSDIPILSFLFSSTRSQEVKSELVFFITPRIIKRKEQTVIVPPSERERLKD